MFADADIEAALPLPRQRRDPERRADLLGGVAHPRRAAGLCAGDGAHGRALRDAARRAGAGRPRRGTVISRRQRDVIEHYLALARDSGLASPPGRRSWPTRRPAAATCGRRFRRRAGCNTSPAGDLRPSAGLIPFDGREAIQIANGTPYGLVAGVWTLDSGGQQLRIARAAVRTGVRQQLRRRRRRSAARSAASSIQATGARKGSRRCTASRRSRPLAIHRLSHKAAVDRFRRWLRRMDIDLATPSTVTVGVTALGTRLSRAACWPRCSSSRAQARSVVAPCQRTASQPTRARPITVSGLGRATCRGRGRDEVNLPSAACDDLAALISKSATTSSTGPRQHVGREFFRCSSGHLPDWRSRSAPDRRGTPSTGARGCESRVLIAGLSRQRVRPSSRQAPPRCRRNRRAVRLPELLDQQSVTGHAGFSFSASQRVR